MTKRDIASHLGVVTSLAPTAAVKADVSGALVDLADCYGAAVIFNVGATTDTWSGTVKYQLQIFEGDASDGSDLAVADAADTYCVNPAGTDHASEYTLADATKDDAKAYIIGYRGSKQYIAAHVEVTGTHTNGTNFSGVVLKGHMKRNTVGVSH